MESDEEANGLSEEETCSSFLRESSKAVSTSNQSEIEEQNKEEDFKVNKSDFVIVQLPT